MIRETIGAAVVLTVFARSLFCNNLLNCALTFTLLFECYLSQ